MTESAAADAERGAVIWRVGDPWRDLREEILDYGTVTFVTENESTTILAVADGHLARLRGRRSGRLLGDETPIPLSGVLVATPCGFVLALSPVTRLRLTGRLVLLLAGAVPDWRSVPLLAPTVHDRSVDVPDVVGHPTEPCGARYCIRIEAPM